MDVNVDSKMDETWKKIAETYAHYKTPFVPCSEDISLMEMALEKWSNHILDDANALILGVTPAITNMNWPKKWRIIGIERSQDVIDGIWPGDIKGRQKAICGDWFNLINDMPKLNVVIGDGSLIACRYPHNIRSLVESISKCMLDGSIFIIRCYCQLPKKETIDDVFASLSNTPPPKIDDFRLRLFMALQDNPTDGLILKDVFQEIMDRGIDDNIMESNFLWKPIPISTFKKWKNSSTVYTFPTLDEIREILTEYFDEITILRPSYNLGQRCPILVMKKK